MICPYCNQGEVLTAIIKHTNMIIYICDECDTVWLHTIDDKTGLSFSQFMENQNQKPLWSELEVLR